MTIPKTINIGGIKYKIELVDMMDINANLGQHDPTRSLISISKKLSEDQTRATLIHEILEAVNYVYDMNLKHHQICLLETALNQTGLFNAC